MFRPQGIYPALLTPFDENQRVNDGELRKLLDFGIDRGLDGIFPISSVGEGIHMDFDEKCRCMDIVVDQVNGRVPVVPGVVASAPAECIKLANHAAAIGCDAVLVTPPYFYKPGGAMVERFFETIIEECDLPVVLYNIPLFTSPLDYDMVKRLVRYPNVVGMKDSSGSMVDFMHFMDKIAIAGEDIAMLTGREETLLSCLLMGAQGCMTATAGVFPEIMVGIYRAWQEGDLETALKLQKMILVVIRTMFAAPFPIGFKLAMELRGIKMGPPLIPPSAADTYQINTVKSRLKMLMDPMIEKYCQELEVA